MVKVKLFGLFFFQKRLALKVSNKMEEKLQLVRAAATTAVIEALPGTASLSGVGLVLQLK